MTMRRGGRSAARLAGDAPATRGERMPPRPPGASTGPHIAAGAVG